MKKKHDKKVINFAKEPDVKEPKRGEERERKKERKKSKRSNKRKKISRVGERKYELLNKEEENLATFHTTSKHLITLNARVAKKNRDNSGPALHLVTFSGVL